MDSDVTKITVKEKRSLLAEAKARGFKKGVHFISATGMPDAFVKGRLVLKENYTDPDEEQFNGDIVSSLGWGCIYNNKTKKWGEII